MLAVWSVPLLAGQWQAQPSLELSETYTDNVALVSSRQAESDFVTQVIPGLSVHGQGARSKLDLNYRLQNLIYANDGDNNDTHSELYANGELELLKDIFFMDARGSITQQIIDENGRVGIDNLNIGNRADVATYGISPRLKLRLKSYLTSDFRVDMDRVENQSPTVSDAESVTYTAHLRSGTSLRRLSWNVGFQRQNLNLDRGADSRRASTQGDLRYHLSSTWNLLVLGGYEDNSVSQSTLERNGFYWSAGLEWHPSRKLTASATGGDDNQTATISLHPSERTSLDLGYQNRDVGLLVGSSWNAGISHQTRHSVWRLQYFEESTATQTLQLTGQQFFVLVDNQGNVIFDPTTGQPLILAQNVFSLTDDQFIRKRTQFSVTVTTGRSDVILSAFNESRHYLISQGSEEVVGGAASWNWKFALRTHSILGASVQKRNPIGTNADDDIWNVSAALVHAVARDTTASLSYSHLGRKYIPGLNYHENRIALQFVTRF
jgi:hypothetical protein